MKFLKKFNESKDIELIEDYLQEYLDKYKFIEREEYYKFVNNQFWKRKSYNGYYKIENVSTFYFKVPGFPNDKEGYVINFYFKPDNINEWRSDMLKFINRVCKEGYNYQTSYSGSIYTISFFK